MWKKGIITFDDGTSYNAEILLNDNGEVWNVKVHKDGHVVHEIDADDFAKKLNKPCEKVYPYNIEITD